MRKSLFGRRRPASGEGSEPEYWLSYSDLMAGLLMVFALMLMAALIYTDRERARLARERDDVAQETKQLKRDREQLERERGSLNPEEKKQQCKIESYEAVADTLLGLLAERDSIVEDLMATFGSSRHVQVDSTTGTVTFAGQLLFEQNSADLSDQRREILKDFAYDYFSALRDNPDYLDRVRRIVIEGHTNSDGEYAYNLGLSHSRALEVMLALLEAEELFETDARFGEDSFRTFLEDRVTANGRADADLILLADGTENKEASRRIEIRLLMDDEPIMDQVLKLELSRCEQ